MNIDCVLIATNLKNRFEKLKTCSQHLDKFNFKNKNLSVDCFNQDSIDDFSDFERRGWKILKHERKGIFGNMVEGVSGLNSDWIFYCEDDVAVEQIPSSDDMKMIEGLKSKGRSVGYISLMFGGMEEGRNIKEMHEYLRSSSSYKKTKNNSQIFLRQEKFKNDFFITFPVALFKRDVLIQLIDYINLYKKGIQVEEAFSQAWMEVNMPEKYCTLSYVKDFDPKKVKLIRIDNITESFRSALGDQVEMFLENRSFIYTMFKSHIFVKTLEQDWNDNSIVGGKSC